LQFPEQLLKRDPRVIVKVSAITGYVVTPFAGGVPQSPRTFLSTATTQTISGLSAGTALVFRVAATNSRGTGPNSAPSNAVTVT